MLKREVSLLSISFEIINKNLILCYSPTFGIEDILRRLSEDEEVTIKRTFTVTKELLRENGIGEFDFGESLHFCIGHVGNDYIQIDSEVLGTNHKFYFSNDIKLELKMFVAYRNISILRKIDNIIEKDFYVGGNWENNSGISLELFMELIESFPKTSELNKYVNSRIGCILKENLPECDKYEEIYKSFIERKSKTLANKANFSFKSNLTIELAQFSEALLELEEILKDSEGIPESTWQEKIHYILQLLYPKYILCTREVLFKGIDGYDKKPDFILVDTNGFVDVLEIKKPEVQVLTKQASYRNNYVPVREFAGAIQQIEKYIFCLTSLEKSQKDVLEKLRSLLPDNITPEIVNPQAILLLGRSENFNAQQKRDFELIKRQYKNIADIMTYDDLIQRLNNIVISLKQRI